MVKTCEDVKRLDSIPVHFSGLKVNDSNQLALVSSSLTTRTWDGAVAVFNDPKYAPNVPHIDYGTPIDSGCTSVDWVTETRLAVATDYGSVEIWDLKETSRTMENSLYLCEHGDICSAVSVSKHTKQLVSGSWDNYIKIWDLEVDLSIHTILIHSDKVCDVKWSPFGSNLFASSSEDKTVKIYDNRGGNNEKPAFTVHAEGVHHATCVEWMDENVVFSGSSGGKITSCDIRKPNSVLNTCNAHSKAVNFLLVVNNTVFSASEDTFVKGFDVNLQRESYSDNRHTDFVTGLAFDPKENVVLSCGWDGNVWFHSLEKNNLS